MLDDFRFAFRHLRKNPGFAIVAVLTLGLGIGAAGAMFGLIQGVLLSPPPFARPDRVVLLSPARVDGQPYKQGSTIGQWMAWRDSSRSFETPALYRWTFNFLILPDGSQSLGGMVVTRNFFSLLGIKPLLGREFTDDETARPNVPAKAVILGYEFWQRRFNGDPKIIGTAITIARQPAPLPVVGVMPPNLRFLPDPGSASEPNYDVNAHVDFWVAQQPDEARPRAGGWNGITRLRDGATLEQARAEVTAIAARQASTETNLQGLTTTIAPVQDELNQDGRRLLIPLFGSVALLFLIACGNVAGLLLARGLRRQQEYALRSALGAGRRRLFAQVLTESVALALVGGTFGAALGVGLIALMKAIGGRAVPRLDNVHLGWPIFLFGLIAALIAAAVAGLLPALRASSIDRFHGLQGSTRTSVSRGERRLLATVSTLQIVLTVALLAGAGLLVRTAANLASVRPGYDTENILAMTVTTMQRETWKAFHVQTLERVSALAGVRSAAYAWGLPLTGNKWSGDMEVIGGDGQIGSDRLVEKLNVPMRSVTPHYFDTLGMPIVEGRGFRDSDDDKAPRVAVVNGAFVRKYFGRTNASHPNAPPPSGLGRKLRFSGDTDPARVLEIVGIVADTRTEALSAQAEPEVYFSLWQNSAFSKHLVLRTTADPLTLAALVRREVHAVDPSAAVEHVTTLDQIRSESIAPRTFALRLLIGFALAATLLALVGLYGVLALSAGSRTKEIAVRKAIGAQRHEILGLILGEGSRMIAVGMVMGIILAVLLGNLLQALLFNVRPADPLALIVAAALFGIVAFAVCLLPAWRAARVDLMSALRQE